MTKPKLLILSPRFPFPLEKGDKLRLYNQIKYLSPYFSIHLIALTENEVSDKSIIELQEFTDGIDIIPQSSWRNIYAVLHSLFSGKSLQTSYYYERKIQSKIAKIVDKVNPDIIHVQLIRLADYVKELPIHKSLDYMDAMSLNMERESKNQPLPLSWIYKRESSLLKRKEAELSTFFDVKWIISEPDKLYLETCGVRDLQVQCNGVDLNYFSPEDSISQDKYDVAFVGNMGYLPNVVAGEYLVHKIQNKMKPKPSVLLAGARPHKRISSLASKNVTITGWMEDIRSAYRDSKILVAPIFSGAGQQNKILEAMAMGKACITTTQVNNAIGATRNEEILLADSEKEFCNAIDYLLNNPEKRLEIAKNARIFVERNFDWKKQVEILHKALDSLLEKE